MYSRRTPGILARSKLYALMHPSMKILDRFDRRTLVSVLILALPSHHNAHAFQLRESMAAFNSNPWLRMDLDAETTGAIDDFVDNCSAVG